jgi:hypothetical protein
MSEELMGFVINSNMTTTVLAIIAAALSFAIALLVVLCDQPFLDPRFESEARSNVKVQ